jgi:hypothetical protein
MSLVTISFDGRPPVSLGTAVVDPLTIIRSPLQNAEDRICVPARRIYFQSRGTETQRLDKRKPGTSLGDSGNDSRLRASVASSSRAAHLVLQPRPRESPITHHGAGRKF